MRLAVRAAVLLLLLLLPPLAFAVLAWEQRWVAEDAFIDFRVVQHVLAGHGPVYNVSERVEVYTNPLWVAVLAGLAALLAPLRTSFGEDISLEWIAVAAGIVGAVAGLGAAQLGALRLLRTIRTDRTNGAITWPVPLGALVLVAVPVAWDFATSGLETGLTFGWLGLVFWALAAAWTPGHGDGGPAPLRGADICRAVLVGLGPLIRPDLAVFSAGFLFVLLGLVPGGRFAPDRRGRRLGVWAGLLLAAGAAPLAYQVFRMGYFATLTPNTALAKEAGLAYWSQGWVYLEDFIRPYRLWIPLLALSFGWLELLSTVVRQRRWRGVALLAMPPLCGLVHALYVVRVGGDFMHGRLLLPSLFALLLPVAVVAGSRRWHAVLPAAVVLPWGLASALWLRPPYFHTGPQPHESIGSQGIADERGFYVRLARHPHPITLADYEVAPWAQDGHALRRLAAGSPRVLAGVTSMLPLAPGVPADVVAVRSNIGLTGYAAGHHVHIVDRLGLGDPIAARLRLAQRRRPGHEKELPDEWVVARFGPRPGAGEADPLLPGVVAARAALGCGALAELLTAIEAPLTADRFLRSVGVSWRLTRLRFPADPVAAQAQLCHDQ